MIKEFEIRKTDISLDFRLDTSYYYFSKIIKELSKKDGVTYQKLQCLCENISDGNIQLFLDREKVENATYMAETLETVSLITTLLQTNHTFQKKTTLDFLGSIWKKTTSY